MEDRKQRANRVLAGRNLEDLSVKEIRSLVEPGSGATLLTDIKDDNLLVIVAEKEGADQVQRRLFAHGNFEAQTHIVTQDGVKDAGTFDSDEPSDEDMARELLQTISNIIMEDRDQRQAKDEARAANPRPPKSKNFPQGVGVVTDAEDLNELWGSTVAELRSGMGKGDAVAVCTRDMQQGHPYALIQASGDAAFVILHLLESHGVIKLTRADGFDFNTLVRGAEA